jgi:hypothetical protein
MMDTDDVRLSIRSDLRIFDTNVDAFRREFRLQCDLLLASMTIRFGWMLVGGLGLFFVAMKLTER